jgi:DNA-binding MarR family transcriptional regulator
VAFIAVNPGANNKQIADGIEVPHFGQVSELLARLARSGLLRKHAGGAGRSNQWWLTPHGEQIAQALPAEAHHIDRHA